MRFSLPMLTRSKQQGVSLVELMISISMGLFIMAGVLQLFATSNQASRTAEGAARIQENARYVLKRLADDIARAGSFGCAGPSSANITNALGSIVTVATDPGSWNDFSGAYISGVNEDAADANVLDGTDTLVLKYADAASAQQITAMVNNNTLQVGDAGSFSDGQVVMAGDCARTYISTIDVTGNQIELDDLTTSAVLTPTTAMAYVYSGETGGHRYYVGTSSGAGAGASCGGTGDNRQNCALFRQTNGAAAEELVQGVHGMEVRYGQDTSTTLNDSAAGIYNSIDRIEIQLQFNAVDTAGQLLTRDITRIFAVRNQR
jgi:type IV pilus assembly protein PilW